MRIVLVYLGNTIPQIFWMNVRHLLSIQQDYQIDIVTNQLNLQVPIEDPRLNQFSYFPRHETSNLLDSLELDTKFRNGFWRLSLERLFAFTQHHIEHPEDSLLHVESDVLLLRNFPFHSFENITNLAWSRVDSHRDVAAIVYSPNSKSSQWLDDKMQAIIKAADEMDDMRMLSQISVFNPNMVTILPSLPQIDSELKNLNSNISRQDSKSISEGFSKFNGVFDPAQIGIWLTGTEPRNYFGLTKKFDLTQVAGSRNFIDPSMVSYDLNDNGILCFRTKEMSIPIFSLHIHSKDLSYFDENFEKQLARDVSVDSSRGVKRSFSLEILWDLIRQNWRNGTLLRFLSWLPIFVGLRRILRRGKQV